MPELSTDQKKLKLKGLNETITQDEFRKHGKYGELGEVTFEGFYKIDTGAMDGCINVEIINFIGDALKIIESKCFRDCKSLIKLNIPEGVVSLGDYSLYQCINLVEISIPSTLQNFGGKNYVFSRAYSLQRFIVSSQNAFFSNSTDGMILIRNKTIGYYGGGGPVVVIPAYITILSSYFFNNMKVTSVIFEEGSNLTSIGSYAFRAISIKKIYFPSKLKSISAHLFDFTTDIEEMLLPASLEEVSSDLLVGQPLKNLTIEPGIKAVIQTADGTVYHKDGTLMYLPDNNEEITIPNITKSIPTSLLQKKYGLKEIKVEVNHSTFYVFEKLLYKFPNTLYSVPGGIENATIDPKCDGMSEYSFAYSKVQNIDFNGAKVNLLPDGLFFNCLLLKTIIFSIPITKIGSVCFEWSYLKEQKMIFDNNLGRIDGSAFISCSFLSIDLSECTNIQNITEKTFEKCPFLEEVLLPPNCTYIGQAAFKGCISLRSIKIPSKLQDISANLFDGCTSLVELKFEKKSMVKKIKAYSFRDCNLSKVELPDAVEELQSSCFAGNKYMQMVGIESEESKLNVINSGVFEGCRELKTLKFGKNLQTISSGAFTGALKLNNIIIANENKYLKVNNGVIYSNDNKKLIICPNSIQNLEVDVNITELSKGAFLGCELLESIKMPSDLNLEIISEEAFFGCISLKNITIPQYVRNISSHAFESCTSLSEVIFLDNSFLEEIGPSSFNGCKNLETITFGEGSKIKNIKSNAFEGCSRLVFFDFSDSLEIIEDESFTNCPLNVINFGSNLTKIGKQSFMGCNHIENVNLPSSVFYVGIGAFSNCLKLKTINYCGTNDLSGSIAVSPGMNVITYTVQEYSFPSLCGILPLRILDRDCNRPSEAFTVQSRLKIKTSFLSLCHCIGDSEA